MRRNKHFFVATRLPAWDTFSHALQQYLYSMATSAPADAVGQRTSAPTIIRDGVRGFRLRLRYTPHKKKKTDIKTSPLFSTREEAQATSASWRLSWEQGHKGALVNPPTLPALESSSGSDAGPSAAKLPQGEFSNTCNQFLCVYAAVCFVVLCNNACMHLHSILQ